MALSRASAAREGGGEASVGAVQAGLLSREISGSLSLAFLAHTCRAQRRDFPATLTTTALDRSSSRWFAASACTAAAEGHQANGTRLLHLLHSTAFRIWVFYIQPPSTFVAHPWTTCERLEDSGMGVLGRPLGPNKAAVAFGESASTQVSARALAVRIDQS